MHHTRLPNLLCFGLAGLMAACAVAPPPLEVSGTAAWHGRIALSPKAVFEASVLDTARADAPARVLGRTRVEAPQTPVAFTIPVDATVLDPRSRPVVRATVTLDGRLLLTTDTAVPVLGPTDVRRVELLLRRVDAAP